MSKMSIKIIINLFKGVIVWNRQCNSGECINIYWCMCVILLMLLDIKSKKRSFDFTFLLMWSPHCGLEQFLAQSY